MATAGSIAARSSSTREPNFTGIELGFGGVWVCATPNLIFFPDRDADDRPDGPPSIVLDGWDTKAQHNMFNALEMGTGRLALGLQRHHVELTRGQAGNRRRPARADQLRRLARIIPPAGSLRPLAHGTTNPWGLDFDDHGEAFITNCVIPHLFHVVPGAHFQRMYGQDFNPNLYGLMESCADHLHWAGGQWTDSREGKGHEKHSAAGGGHAHVGAMIYLGDNWPDSYRQRLLTFNLHGHRANLDRLERNGSGYVARHEPDFLMANDTWFRGLELKYGPDGRVYFTDWSDRGECHENDADNAHRENGRIYTLSFGKPTPIHVNLAAASNEDLARLQLHKNDWHVRTARRLLQERAAQGADLSECHRILQSILKTNQDTTRRLRALWALNATGGLDDKALMSLLDDGDESIRGWAIRLLSDRGAPSAEALDRFVSVARSDPSPRVRLNLASALQRIPVNGRWPLAEALVMSKIDPKDPMLPLLTWYGIEPLVEQDPVRASALASRCTLSLHRNYLARRAVTANASSGLSALFPVLEQATNAVRVDILSGILEALRGRKQVPRPEGWSAAFAKLLESHDPERCRADTAPGA